MKKPIPALPHSASGFTLVEIMVGLAIGMLATMVILQVISVFEAQKRVTTGTADAQTNGSIALYNITRELGLAGYPLMPITDSPLECTTVTFGTTNIGSISPVSITDDNSITGSTSDIITIRYGNSAMGGVPTAITGNGATANERTLGNNFGCAINDHVIIVNGSTCALTTASEVSAASAIPPTITIKDTTNATAGANLACLGRWSEVSYRIAGNNLQRCNKAELDANGNTSDCIITASTTDPDWRDRVADVVNIQAQYGISASPTSNQVTQWVDATSPWDAPSISDRNRIKAIRIAIVSRNAKEEGTDVTTGLNAWTGSASSPAPAIDLSADANWKKYRYRVFETIVPLRNVIWSKDTL